MFSFFPHAKNVPLITSRVMVMCCPSGKDETQLNSRPHSLKYCYKRKHLNENFPTIS